MSKTPRYNQRPYFDDFNEGKRFLRMLFRPGFAVQARELTQLQTMLQSQMGDFADSIFENGSMVIPGEVKLHEEYSFIKVQSPLDVDFSAFIGREISDGLITATLLNVVPAVGADPLTLYVGYNSGDGQQNTRFTFQPSSTVSLDTPAGPVAITIAAGGTAVGNGLAAHIKNGVYYFNSLFVPVVEQTLILKKYTNDYTADTISVGLDFQQKFITEQDDPSILDNAAGSTNFAAPGAHRLRFDVALSNAQDVVNKDSFVEVLRLQEGVIQKKVSAPEYSVLEQTLARRTYDESGDYTVRDFALDVREHLDNDTNRGVFEPAEGGDSSLMVYDVDRGKAYVRGFEIESLQKTRLIVPKARTTESRTSVFAYAPVGSYIEIENLNGPLPTIGSTTIPSITITDGAWASPITAKIRTIVGNGNGTWKLYLYDVSIPDGTSFELATTIAGSGFTADLVQGSTLVDPAGARSIFPITSQAAESISTLIYQTSKTTSAVAVGGDVTIVGSVGTLLPTTTGAFQVYVDDAPEDTVEPTSVIVSGSNRILTLPAPYGSFSGNVTVTHSIRKIFNDQTFIKTKTKTTTSVVQAPASSISLGKVDGLRIVSIIGDDSVDYSGLYQLDGGQRDNQYLVATVNLRSGFVVPTATSLTIEFEHYEHTGTGAAFCADSYVDSYDDKPTYIGSGGEEFNLIQCLDFRQVVNSAGSAYVTAQEMIYPDSELQYDFSFYLPRVDKIVLGADGIFTAISGTPSINPQPPEDADNQMTLYVIDVPAYTYSVSDTVIEKIENKRYTMRDIGAIENRVKNLEYITSLNLLEQSTKNIDVGNAFKSGFVVDSFAGHDTGDVSDPTYSFSVDLEEAEGRAEASIKAVELDILTQQSANYRQTGDLITLPYTEKVLVDQPLASNTLKINPFAVFSWIGQATLTPASDTWISIERKPDIIEKKTGVFKSLEFIETKKNKGFGTVWNAWETLWTGQSRAGRLRLSNTRQQRTGIQVKPVVQTQVNLINDKVLNTSVIPYIREKKISFRVTRMKPNTRLYVFFDGKNITEYAEPSIIITDSAGTASGFIDIPNNDKVRFLVGDKSVIFSSDPVDPYAVDSYAQATYSAAGILETRQASYVSTRVKTVTTVPKTSTRNVRRVLGWIDPLAQSFLTDTPGGVFLTSVDVFFGVEAEDLEDPVTVQIRNMVNGYPGTEILPFGEITLQPSQVLGSADGTVATRFTFESPVYIQENTEYCFVVLSNSEILTAWIATQGQLQRQPGDTTSNTGSLISKQPYAGVLFKSQNNTTWTAEQTSDLKFKINRAQFDINAASSVVFSNLRDDDNVRNESDPYSVSLGQNPIFTTEASTTVRVIHANHDLAVGDNVSLYYDGDIGSIGSLNGLLVADLFSNDVSTKILVVTNVIDLDTYEFEVQNAATATGFVGGARIRATQNVQYSVAKFLCQELIPNGTKIDWSFAGIILGGSPDQSFIPILANTNIQFGESRISRQQNNNSIRLRASLKSTSDNISPVIDVERLTMFAVENRINGQDDSSGVAESRYMIKKTTLINPANTIRLFLDVNKPSNTTVKLYYKVGGAEADFDAMSWSALPYSGVEPGATDDISIFNEYQYDSGNLGEFTKYQVKIVLSSAGGNRQKTPRVRNLRALAIYV